jgi:2,3-bisphosphoglycerate-independent phosphoglycerate mutase
MAVFFLFIDGIGIGSTGEQNPFSSLDLPGFNLLTGNQKMDNTMATILEDDHVYSSIDACLKVDGLPQSGTGQATLFSGVNASSIIGHHFGPYPHSKNKYLLESESIFHQIQKKGYAPFFINAFPKIFFEKVSLRNRWSCCTLMTKSAGLSINSENEVISGAAITAEILQDYWEKHLNINISAITYKDAAYRVVKSLEKYDLVLMEYYLTDKAGHSMNKKDAEDSITRIDNFIHALYRMIGEKDTIVVTSDHGNIEDMSVKTHTFNPVPLIVKGPGATYFKDATDLTNITPAIINAIAG